MNLEEAAEQAGCKLRLKLVDEGAPVHPVKYRLRRGTRRTRRLPDPTLNRLISKRTAPTAEMPSEINIVHTLEHGRLEIQYAPDLPKKDQLALKGLYDTMYGATLLFPNDKMPYAVAATTWSNMLGCPEYKGAITLDAIRAFGKETWGRYGGEPAEPSRSRALRPRSRRIGVVGLSR